METRTIDPAFPHLRRFAEGFPSLAEARQALDFLGDPAEETDPGRNRIYGAAALALVREALARREGPDGALLDLAGQLLAEREFQLAGQDPRLDLRHEFVVVIPVADRPEMLEDCLESLHAHCRRFGYGGLERRGPDRVLRKVRAVVADDSRDPACRARHAETARRFTGRGLRTDYFGLEEQGALIASYRRAEQVWLRPLVGRRGADGLAPPHKGASTTRNLALLRLQREIPPERADRTLIWFVDSDEAFVLRLDTPSGPVEKPALSYFHVLDHLFSSGKIDVLTGRVVGDPPVAPAIMSHTLLADVLAFTEAVAAGKPDGPCPFHRTERREGDRAALYHDLIELFGYRRPEASTPFHCARQDPHSLAETARAFARDLPAFFHGRHPTREVLFDRSDPPDRPAPARTVYTGNYVLRASLPDLFIPFAHLNLRMAGPTLGRLLRARLGDRFVTLNLPLLHRRTLRGETRSEFRHGLSTSDGAVDISDQMFRQFWGDCLLFSVEGLTREGFPDRPAGPDRIDRVVEETVLRLARGYAEARRGIREKLARLRARLCDPSAWWNRGEGAAGGFRRSMEGFAESLAANFGPGAPGVRRLEASIADRVLAGRLKEAIAAYAEDRRTWSRALGRNRETPEPTGTHEG